MRKLTARLLSPLFTLAIPLIASAQNPVPYVWSTVAGAAGVTGANNGQGAAAQFNQPMGITADANGIIYVVDSGNNSIRRIDTSGNVTTLAGLSGSNGFQDGLGTNALFNGPSHMTVDSNFNLYVTDTGNGAVRYVSTAGLVTTPAFAYQHDTPQDDFSGECVDPNTGPWNAFYAPDGILIWTNGNPLVLNSTPYIMVEGDCQANSDTLIYTVRSIAPNLDVTSPYYVQLILGGMYYAPQGLAAAPGGQIYTGSGNGNGLILVFDPEAPQQFNDGFSYIAGFPNMLGTTDGTGLNARFWNPQDVACDAAGNIYVADTGGGAGAGGSTIRMVTPGGVVTTIGGVGGSVGSVNQAYVTARFNQPKGIYSTTNGILYVSDSGNNTIRKGVPVPIAIYTEPLSAIRGIGYSVTFTAQVLSSNALPYTIGWFQNGNPIPNATNLTLTITNLQATNAGSYVLEVTNAAGSAISTVATLIVTGYAFSNSIGGIQNPAGVGFDSVGNLYATDSGHQVVWKANYGNGDGAVQIAGLYGTTGTNDGPGAEARFNGPSGLVVTPNETLYLCDYNNDTIRQINPAGVVSTIAGTATMADYYDGPANEALFNNPQGLAMDSLGNLYVGDHGNGAVRKLTASASWQVSTIATGFSGPCGVAVDSSFNVYVADSGHDVIAKIAPGGVVSTFAGISGSAGSADGPALQATFSNPQGLFLDSLGNLFVGDLGNDTIRYILNGQYVGTIAGSPGIYNFLNGTGSAAAFRNPLGITEDPAGTLYVADYNNGAVRVGTALVGPNVAPSITYPPINQTFVATYGTATFGLEAAGSPTLTYQWNTNGVPVLNATNSTFALSPPQLSNAATYSVTVANGVSPAVTSPGAVLTMLPAYTVSTLVSGLGGSGYPTGIGFDSLGYVYIVDNRYHVIYKMSVAAGTGPSVWAGLYNAAGASDGIGAMARFSSPWGLALDTNNDVFVADFGNNTIRMISPSSSVRTIAGTAGSTGFQNGPGSTALLNGPTGICVDKNTNVFFCEYGNGSVRKMINGPSGWQVTTLASGFYQPSGVALDSSGNVYVADSGNEVIEMITPGGTVSLVAGQYGRLAFDVDGPWSYAQFNYPRGIAINGAGQIVVADWNNNSLRVITPGQNVMTVVGGTYGYVDNTGSAAQFRNPVALAFDSAGDLYIADYNNAAVRVRTLPEGSGVSPSIVVQPQSQTVVATYGPANLGVEAEGSPTLTYQWNTNGAAVPGATSSTFTLSPPQLSNAATYTVTVANGVTPAATSSNAVLTVLPAYTISTLANGIGGSGYPSGIGFDSLGYAYVVDNRYHVIYRMSVATGAGPSVWAGLYNAAGTNDGIGATARFSNPWSLALDTNNDVFVTDNGNNTIRMISPSTSVRTIAGTPGSTGFQNGPGAAALLNGPAGICVDKKTNVYFCEYQNGSVRKLTNGPSGWQVTTLASGFNEPSGVALDSAGNVYVADSGNDVIEMITPNGTVSLVAGQYGRAASVDGPWSYAQFNFPRDIAISSSGQIIVADWANNSLRVITPGQNVMTVAGGTYGYVDSTGSAAQFRNPVGLTFDSSGDLYIADYNNSAVRVRTVPEGSGVSPSIVAQPQSQTVVATYGPANFGVEAEGSPTLSYQWNTNGVPVPNATNSTYTLSPPQLSNAATYAVTVANGVAPAATSSNAVLTVLPAYTISTLASGLGGGGYPSGVGFDSLGYAYMVDNRYHVIYKMSVATGAGPSVWSGLFNAAGTNDGLGATARFSNPWGLGLDTNNDVFVADSGNNTIRMISPSSAVTTIAGAPGIKDYRDGSGGLALLNNPRGLCLDKNTNIYIADFGNNVVRKLTNGPSGWQVTTLASGFNQPNAVALDSSDNVYVADSGNHVIEMITPGGSVSLVAGQYGRAANVDGAWSYAQLNYPQGIAVNSLGQIMVADTGNNSLRVLTLGQNLMTVAGSGYGYNDATGSAALFKTPVALAFDSVGDLYIADYNNSAVRVRTVPESSGVSPSIAVQPQSQTVVATYGPANLGVEAEGSPTLTYQWNTNGVAVPGATNPTFSLSPPQLSNAATYSVTVANGVSPSATSSNAVLTVLPAYTITTLTSGNGVDNPAAIAIDTTGNAYFSDNGRHVIYKLAVGAGTAPTVWAGYYNATGTNDGLGSVARFTSPWGVALDPSNDVFVGDSGNDTIRMIAPNGNVTTIAGAVRTTDYRDGPGALALFNGPRGLAVDKNTNIFVADYGNGAVRKLTNGFSGWQVSTLASGFNQPNAVALDSSDNVYVADSQNHVIEMITPAGSVSLVAGQYGRAANVDGPWSYAQFNYPQGIAVNSSGQIIVADTGNNSLRVVTLGQNVMTVAGSGYGYNDGTGSAVQFKSPVGLTFDSEGNLYVADYNNGALRIRYAPVNAGTPPSIDVQPQSQTVVATYGPANFGVLANGSPTLTYQWSTNGVALPNATSATLAVSSPLLSSAGTYSVTVANGISPAATSSNVVLTVLTPYTISNYVGGLGAPSGVTADSAGNIYFTDYSRNVIYKTTPPPSSTTTVYAGSSGNPGTNNGAGGAARFNGPYGIGSDTNGDLFVADNGSHAIRFVASGGVVSTMAGLPNQSGFRDGLVALFHNPGGIFVDSKTNVFVADVGNNAVRKITNSASGWYVTTIATGFNQPNGVVEDSAGDVYVADSANEAVEVINHLTGAVSVVAGLIGAAGNVDGPWGYAQFNFPQGITIDNAGNLIVADANNNSLRYVVPSQAVWTMAGSSYGFQNGIGSGVQFKDPIALGSDPSGDLFIADHNNGYIRERIALSGTAPIITLQPQSQDIAEGGSVTFTVAATGSAPLYYQWESNGAPLIGQTTTSLTFNQLVRGNSANYTVDVSNPITNVVSGGAVLRVLVQPLLQAPQVLPNHGGLQFMFKDADGGIPSDLTKIRLEWRATLPSGSDTNWNIVNTTYTIVNGYVVMTDPTAGAATTRFYQVEEY